eukprot:CAMPEP_0115592472 /NCGR_PEP_ID=MMETSP0272-20121206/10805_1 /TAXON_ID=71861 /ORGANISM="Scrippsiella trochoidea, Strain CCMP3099" /LENGTH=126 /DNA_ID=CAMNT_0003027715 /DNA_START=256 /DNA_END=640 /DNA_ORIENTATION=-
MICVKLREQLGQKITTDSVTAALLQCELEVVDRDAAIHVSVEATESGSASARAYSLIHDLCYEFSVPQGAAAITLMTLEQVAGKSLGVAHEAPKAWHNSCLVTLPSASVSSCKKASRKAAIRESSE